MFRTKSRCFSVTHKVHDQPLVFSQRHNPNLCPQATLTSLLFLIGTSTMQLKVLRRFYSSAWYVLPHITEVSVQMSCPQPFRECSIPSFCFICLYSIFLTYY